MTGKRKIQAFALLAHLLGCGAAPTPVPTTPESPPSSPPDVASAALPFAVLMGRGGSEVPIDRCYQELFGARVVCIGEEHPNPHHHWAQLRLLDELSQRQKAAGIEGALGLEMIQRPFQGVLDDYASGKIDEETLLARVGWKTRWGFDFALYRPMLRLARERGLALLALNAVKELTRKVSRKGIDALTEAERAQLPEIDLEDDEHRAWFFGLMEAMGGAGAHGDKKTRTEADKAAAEARAAAAAARAQRVYAAQVLWDETMAETAANWLAGGESRQVIILAGGGHCHASGIIRRLKRRGVSPALSVQPVVDDGEGNVADLLAEQKNDYLFVMKGESTAGEETAAPQGAAPPKPPHPMPPRHPDGGEETRPPHPTPPHPAPRHPDGAESPRPPHPMPRHPDGGEEAASPRDE